MRLTKKLMWKIVIELWEWLAEDGSRIKRQWPRWEKYGYMEANCPFCEYYDACKNCPINYCTSTIFAFANWQHTETDIDRKKYAGLFLEQLKNIRDGGKGNDFKSKV